MSAPLQPSVRLVFRLEHWPAETTDVYRWGIEPLADVEFTEGRIALDGWSDVERALSGIDGHYAGGTFTFLAHDDDGYIRALMRGETTQFFLKREASLELLSAAGRAAGLDWRSVWRGILANAQQETGRKFRGQLRDIVGATFALDLDQPVLKLRMKDLGLPNCPAEHMDRFIPAIWGEHTDKGAINAAGTSAEKGMIQPIYAGQWLTTDDDPSDSEPAFLAAPSGVTASVTGSSGTRVLTYAVAFHSAYGQTPIGNVVVVDDAPDVLDGSNYITLDIGAWPAEAVAATIYGRQYSTPVRKLVTLTAGETMWADTGQAVESLPGPQIVNTAQVPLPEGGFFWDLYIVVLGPIPISRWFAAEVTVPGAQPVRTLMPESTAGVDFLIPGFSGWTGDLTLTINGIEVTAFLARGPRSQAHRDDVVKMAVDVCGYPDNNGVPITESFRQLQHMVNEFLAKNKGEGWRSGPWGPLETFGTGVPVVQPSAFEACQETSIGFIGGRGYQGAWVIDDDTTWRTFLQWFCVTHRCYITINSDGQVQPVLFDRNADPETFALYREGIEIPHDLDVPAPVTDWEGIRSKALVWYDWDPDGQRFRGGPDPLEAEVLLDEGYRRTRDEQVQCRCSRHRQTVRDAQQRWLDLYAKAPIYQPVPVGMEGIEQVMGGRTLVTIPEWGWVEQPMLVVGHRYSPNTDSCLLTMLDVGHLPPEEEAT